jgi:hypothetical protein
VVCNETRRLFEWLILTLSTAGKLRVRLKFFSINSIVHISVDQMENKFTAFCGQFKASRNRRAEDFVFIIYLMKLSVARTIHR